MLLIVAYEVTKLLLSALQRGVKLLHLVHQVGFLCFQTLTVRLHGCGKAGREEEREERIKFSPEDSGKVEIAESRPSGHVGATSGC